MPSGLCAVLRGASHDSSGRICSLFFISKVLWAFLHQSSSSTVKTNGLHSPQRSGAPWEPCPCWTYFAAPAPIMELWHVASTQLNDLTLDFSASKNLRRDWVFSQACLSGQSTFAYILLQFFGSKRLSFKNEDKGALAGESLSNLTQRAPQPHLES